MQGRFVVRSCLLLDGRSQTDQRLDHFRVARLDGNVQGSIAFVRFGINMLAPLNDRLDHFRVASTGGHVDWLGPCLVGHVQCNASLHEDHGRARVASGRGQVHQCTAIFGALMDGSTKFLRQKVHRFHVTILGGQMERRSLLFVHNVWLRSDHVQEFDELFVAHDGGHVQGRLAFVL